MSRSECHASSLLTDTQVLRLIQGMAPKKPTRSPDPQEALALMQEGRVRGHGRRSPIVIWMQKNQAALAQGFAETTPSWAKLAAYLGDHGITDGDGKRPTAEATRQAWYRTNKGSARAKGQPAAPAPSPPASAPALPIANADATEPGRRTYSYVKPRGLDPAGKAPDPPSAPAAKADPSTPETPTVNVDDVLARFAPGTTRR